MADARGLSARDERAHYVGPRFAHCGWGFIPGRLVAREGKHPSSIDDDSMSDISRIRLRIGSDAETVHHAFAIVHATNDAQCRGD